MQQVEARKTGWQTTTAIINDLLALALASSLPRGTPTTTREEVLPLQAVNKDKDVDLSLRAEEAHVEQDALEAVQAPAGLKRHQVARSIDPAFQSLQCHADLIQEFWRARLAAF